MWPVREWSKNPETCRKSMHAGVPLITEMPCCRSKRWSKPAPPQARRPIGLGRKRQKPAATIGGGSLKPRCSPTAQQEALPRPADRNAERGSDHTGRPDEAFRRDWRKEPLHRIRKPVRWLQNGKRGAQSDDFLLNSMCVDARLGREIIPCPALGISYACSCVRHADAALR